MAGRRSNDLVDLFSLIAVTMSVVTLAAIAFILFRGTGAPAQRQAEIISNSEQHSPADNPILRSSEDR